MVTKYSEKEIEAMEAKLNDPATVVICPRCGEELQLMVYKSACEVKCKTQNCLHGVVRGI